MRVTRRAAAALRCRGRRPVAQGLLLAALLSACAFPGLEPERPADMPEAIGPVVELGRGESLGVAWRYSILESTEGTCTRVEMQAALGATESCGGVIGNQGAESISLMGVGTGTGMPSQVEGFAAEEVAAVWIETDAGRVPVTLMSLEPAGLDGQVFFGLVPGDRRMRVAVAADAAGQELGRVSIEAP